MRDEVEALRRFGAEVEADRKLMLRLSSVLSLSSSQSLSEPNAEPGRVRGEGARAKGLAATTSEAGLAGIT